MPIWCSPLHCLTPPSPQRWWKGRTIWTTPVLALWFIKWSPPNISTLPSLPSLVLTSLQWPWSSTWCQRWIYLTSLQRYLISKHATNVFKIKNIYRVWSLLWKYSTTFLLEYSSLRLGWKFLPLEYKDTFLIGNYIYFLNKPTKFFKNSDGTNWTCQLCSCLLSA